MEVNKGLLAFFAEEEVAVGVVVHEEVFGEDGGAAGVAEEVEGGFLVGVAVGVVGAEAHAGEVGLGGVVEGIGTGGAGSGVGAIISLWAGGMRGCKSVADLLRHSLAHRFSLKSAVAGGVGQWSVGAAVSLWRLTPWRQLTQSHSEGWQ